jgi:acyl carrier protein
VRRRAGADPREIVARVIREAVPGHLRAAVQPAAALQDDLELDSLALLGVVLRLKDELGIDPVALADKAGDIVTVEDAVEAVVGLLPAGAKR